MTWSRRMFLAGASSLGAAHLTVPYVFAQTPLKKVRLAIGFLAFGRHAPFYLARERGYYRDVGLDVQFDHLGGNALAFQSLVSGGSDICISDVMQMFQLEIEGKSPPMRSLAIIHQKHPLTIFFLKSRGISEPKDLIGRTMVDSPGGMIVHFFPAFAEANGLDPNGIKYTHAAPTAKMALVLQEKADMAESYIFAVPNLKSQLQPGQELGWFMYGDYGVHAYADAIVATQEFIDKDPAAARGFAKATMRGFSEAFQDPEAAVAAIAKHVPALVPETALQEVLMLKDIVTPADGKPFGYHDPARMEWTAEAVAKLMSGKLPNPISSYYTNEAL